jgi:hypothetical protein
MYDEGDLPSGLVERARMMENLLIARATGMDADTGTYEFLRREFMGDPSLRPLLPDFVRTCRTLDSFWPYIKDKAGSYADRRFIIGTAFNPLIDSLEGANQAPADAIISDTLQAFDLASVHAVWDKAIKRRHTDAEGAITSARTLLETVCKHILDDIGAAYTGTEDLPKLYGLTARALNLAPDQHSEEAFRSILGGAMTVVNGLGSLRNRLSDAHGRGARGVKPSPRHASLAVNMAGAVATFLVETYTERSNA